MQDKQLLNKALLSVLATWWADEAALVLRAEIKRSGVKYSDLAERLRAINLPYSAAAVRNKLSRGSFGFDFAMQCMYVLGRTSISTELKRPLPEWSKVRLELDSAVDSEPSSQSKPSTQSVDTPPSQPNPGPLSSET